MEQQIELSKISPSKTNPRQTFEPVALGELTESIKKQGVLQAILVRKDKGGFEIIAGERRWRAAKAAGLKEIPARVMTVDDKQVLEIQVVENLQRADLHPLEEGEGYKLLIDKHGYQVNDLAVKVHKSRSYIFHRLSLTKLSPKVKKLFLSDELKASEAELIGRLEDPAQQDRVVEHSWDDTADLKRIIEERYLLDLKKAPWNLDDDTLVPAAGSCSACPKRSSAQGDLFGAGKRDFCLEGSCWAGKVKAHAEVLKKRYESQGKKVLTGPKAVKAIQEAGNYQAEYSGLDTSPNWLPYSSGPDRNLRVRLKGAEIESVLAIGQDGRPHELVKTEEAKKVVVKSMTSAKAASRPVISPAEKLKRARANAELRGRKAACDETARQVSTVFSEKPLKGLNLQLVIQHVLRSASHDSVKQVTQRLGLQPVEEKHYKDFRAPLQLIVDGKDEKAWLELLAHLMIGNLDFPEYSDKSNWRHFEQESVRSYRGESKADMEDAKKRALDVRMEEMFKTGHVKRLKTSIDEELAKVKAPKGGTAKASKPGKRGKDKLSDPDEDGGPTEEAEDEG